MNDLHEMAANSREAAWTLAASSLETRNAALLRMAEVLENHQADIFAANAADIHQAEADGLAAPLLGRLKFREEKLRAVTDGLRALADLPDPIGATTMTHEITPGLKMYRVTCPIGVIGVIFESRPDALVQIAIAGAQERQCRAAQGRSRGGADERRAVRRAPGGGGGCRASGGFRAAAAFPRGRRRHAEGGRAHRPHHPPRQQGVRPLHHGQQPHSRAGALRRHLPRLCG